MSGGGIFAVIGPVMVGPSSSHTAGAARLGWAVRAILGTANPFFSRIPGYPSGLIFLFPDQ